VLTNFDSLLLHVFALEGELAGTQHRDECLTMSIDLICAALCQWTSHACIWELVLTLEFLLLFDEWSSLVSRHDCGSRSLVEFVAMESEQSLEPYTIDVTLERVRSAVEKQQH
jgi:hypothetical protein